MTIAFSNIEDFININKKCLFCDSNLEVILTNLIGYKNNGASIISSYLDGDHFKFKLPNNNSSAAITNGKINIKTNLLTFDIPCNITNLENELLFLKNYFSKLYPHLEIYCPNKKCSCKYSYYLCSDTFKFDTKIYNNSFVINKISLFMESFRYNNFWIQNNFFNKKTNIFMKNNPDANPVEVDFIDFTNIHKNKFLNKIKSIILFS